MTTTEPHTGRRSGHQFLPALFAALATVTAVTVAVVAAVVGDGSEPASPSSAPSQAPPAVASLPTSGSTAPSSSQPAAVPFAYQPLWPFSTTAEVEHWQAGYRSGGHSPWHLDADATALAFTTGYLGFAGIDTVVWHSVTGDEALVAVGYPVIDRPANTAAVLHLARYGSGPDAPWEVVGSRDTDLTLTQPAYGVRASSPLTVGGTITGVDESIRVQIHQPQSPAPIGEACCLPAGGEGTAWSTTVTYAGAAAPALTVVASTGGHYIDVERFAITAVRP